MPLPFPNPFNGFQSLTLLPPFHELTFRILIPTSIHTFCSCCKHWPVRFTTQPHTLCNVKISKICIHFIFSLNQRASSFRAQTGLICANTGSLSVPSLSFGNLPGVEAQWPCKALQTEPPLDDKGLFRSPAASQPLWPSNGSTGSSEQGVHLQT